MPIEVIQPSYDRQRREERPFSKTIMLTSAPITILVLESVPHTDNQGLPFLSYMGEIDVPAEDQANWLLEAVNVTSSQQLPAGLSGDVSMH